MDLQFLFAVANGAVGSRFMYEYPVYFVGTYAVIYGVLHMMPRLCSWVQLHGDKTTVSPQLCKLLYGITIAVLCLQIFQLVCAMAWSGTITSMFRTHRYPLNFLPLSFVETLASRGAVSYSRHQLVLRQSYSTWSGLVRDKAFIPLARLQFTTTLVYGLGIAVSTVVDSWNHQSSTPYTNNSVRAICNICSLITIAYPTPSTYAYLMGDLVLLVELTAVLVNALLDCRRLNFAASLVIRSLLAIYLILDETSEMANLSAFQSVRLAGRLSIFNDLAGMARLFYLSISGFIWLLGVVLVGPKNLATPFDERHFDATVLVDQHLPGLSDLLDLLFPERALPLPRDDDITTRRETWVEENTPLEVVESPASDEVSSVELPGATSRRAARSVRRRVPV